MCIKKYLFIYLHLYYFKLCNYTKLCLITCSVRINQNPLSEYKSASQPFLDSLSSLAFWLRSSVVSVLPSSNNLDRIIMRLSCSI